jgi:hypothetical protein
LTITSIQTARYIPNIGFPVVMLLIIIPYIKANKICAL